eukprot:2465396-Pyramimonas_sp.AAC.1
MRYEPKPGIWQRLGMCVTPGRSRPLFGYFWSLAAEVPNATAARILSTFRSNGRQRPADDPATPRRDSHRPRDETTTKIDNDSNDSDDWPRRLDDSTTAATTATAEATANARRHDVTTATTQRPTTFDESTS